MTVRNLDALFQPGSVAVIGASARESSVGFRVLRNLIDGGFAGPVMPVNPKQKAIAGIVAYPDVASLPHVPDLAVICTPAPTVPGLIAELGAAGTRAAVVLTAGLDAQSTDDGRTLTQAMLDAARPHLLRILGHNCVGLLVPGIELNASFSQAPAAPGNIALVSQSGAMCTAILDWAEPRGIGFSHFVSLGNSADVDFGDVIDYLADDRKCDAILLYIEAVTDARKFMSAARAAARIKPIVAVKAGRHAEGARAAASHTGALAGNDAAYDAAFHRAGILRVTTIEDLFDTVEVLARAEPETVKAAGDRLAILTNGGGPGVLATDAVIDAGGRMAELPGSVRDALDKVLPANWSRANPIDIIGDANAERYKSAIEPVLEGSWADALLLVHAPTAMVDAAEIAGDLAPVLAASERPVFTCWLGGRSAESAAKTFADAGVPHFQTPEEAVNAFLLLNRRRRRLERLAEVPPAGPENAPADRATAAAIVAKVNAEGRDLLTEPEAKDVMAAYGIPVVQTRIAADTADAIRLADELGYPVALKILSPDISHKSDVGGVVLDLETADAVETAANDMRARVHDLKPDAGIDGFTVQQMARRPDAHELIAGASADEIFGPLILFGHGGTAVEVVADRALGLPPLNRLLARDMIDRTRIVKLLRGYRDRPAADIEAVADVLIRLGQMMIDHPSIAEIDINPLLADENGVLALDARIRIAEEPRPGSTRLAIRPYPADLVRPVEIDGRALMLRPIRPQDEALYHVFFDRTDDQDRYFRFFSHIRTLSKSWISRLTQVDYEREMALVLIDPDENGAEALLGVVRTITDPDNERAEFAILLRSDMKGKGVGRLLMEAIVDYCRSRGTATVAGMVLPENRAMQGLARKLGFSSRFDRDSECVEVMLDIRNTPD